MADRINARKYFGRGIYEDTIVPFGKDVEVFEDMLEEMGYFNIEDIKITSGIYTIRIYGPSFKNAGKSSAARGRKFFVDIGNNTISEYILIDSIVLLIEFLNEIATGWEMLGGRQDETKFICITGSISDGLLALDNTGLVWKYDKSSQTWKRIPLDRE